MDPRATLHSSALVPASNGRLVLLVLLFCADRRAKSVENFAEIAP
jgi:hypothetical protein